MMLNKIRDNWSSCFANSILYTLLAMIALFKNDMVEISLILFGIGSIFTELSRIQKQIKIKE